MRLSYLLTGLVWFASIQIGLSQTDSLSAGTIGSSQIICHNNIPEPLTEITSASGGTGEYSYQWQQSSDGTVWSNIEGATGVGYSPAALTSSTYFRRLVSSGLLSPVSSPAVQISATSLQAQLHENITIENNSSANIRVMISGGTPPYTVQYTCNDIPQTPVAGYISGTDISTGALTPGSYIYALSGVTDSQGCTANDLGTGITVTVTSMNTYHYDFTYPDRAGMIAAGWDFIGKDVLYQPRNTEQLTGAVVSYDQQAHPGVIRIPVDVGDLMGDQNNTRNSIFRNLPSTWSSIRLKLASFNPTVNYQQAGLVLYQNDNNYVQLTRTYEYGNRISFISEILGGASTLKSIEVNSTTNIYFRLDRDQLTETITAYYSLDGNDWILVGSDVHPLPRDPRLGIVAGASPGGFPNADFEWAEIYTDNVDVLRVYPSSNVFNEVEGHASTVTRAINMFTTLGRTINWNITKDVSWATLSSYSGVTEASVNVGVNTNGLAAGVYYGNITISSVQSLAPPVVVPVTLIVNPDVPVTATTWMDGKAGAMSVSVDDGAPTGFTQLEANGFSGTFVTQGDVPPDFYDDYYNAGMELGSHLTSHTCDPVADAVLITQEIEPNVNGICTYTPQPCNDLITLIWPCGYTNNRYKSIASEYFLSARGYNINQLEDATPQDFMNLKSFNTHGHIPEPPADYKTIVDMAIEQQKWFNMVLHWDSSDDAAIDYAADKDIWVSSIGRVIKYILQRDRIILSDYISGVNNISFNVTRLAIPSSSIKNFEEAFNAGDSTTLRVDIDDDRYVQTVMVNNSEHHYEIKNVSGNMILMTNVALRPDEVDNVEIRYYDESLPRINLSTNVMEFNTHEFENPQPIPLAITTTVPDSFTWTVTTGVTTPSWLSISQAAGSGNDTILVSADVTNLVPGTYNNSITIVSPEAYNSPQVVNVTLAVLPEGLIHLDFEYPDRAGLVADGWSFIATTPAGSDRNTEQYVGAVVSYDQAVHPGVLRIPADLGDLWAALNDTRNSLFRTLPDSWISIRLFLAYFNPITDFQQAGLVLYQDDDNYLQVTRNYNGGNLMSSISEFLGSPQTLSSVNETAVSGIYMRIDRDPLTSTFRLYYSLDGLSWISMGNITRTFSNPKLGIIVGASYQGFPNADIGWVEIWTDAAISKKSFSIYPMVEDKVNFKLHQNYPNPFSTFTSIEYELSTDTFITLEVYDASGRKTETLVNRKMQSGSYRYIWEPENYPSGTYYLSLKTPSYRKVIRMSYVK